MAVGNGTSLGAVWTAWQHLRIIGEMKCDVGVSYERNLFLLFAGIRYASNRKPHIQGSGSCEEELQPRSKGRLFRGEPLGRKAHRRTRLPVPQRLHTGTLCE